MLSCQNKGEVSSNIFIFLCSSISRTRESLSARFERILTQSDFFEQVVGAVCFAMG